MPYRIGSSQEMKERLATEKLYLEDEIRLDHNNGNMVGAKGRLSKSVLKSVQIVAPTDATVLILGRNRHRKGTRRPGHSRVERPQ